MKHRLAIDLGNTIILDRQPIPHAIRVVRRLVLEKFGVGDVFIISRVTPEQKIRARRFVTTEPFRSGTGLPLEQVHFCAERHEKGEICRKLNITHIIDDRPEVMAHMPEHVIHRILFNPDPKDCAEFKVHITNAKIVRDWHEVEKHFFPAKQIRRIAKQHR